MNTVNKYQAELYKHHKSLIEQLPLDTPFTVLIEPTNICNFRCIFCSSQHEKFKDQIERGMMSMDTFHEICDQLEQYPNRIRKITLCKDGEGFVNHNIIEMAKYLKINDLCDIVSTTTNGSLFHKFNFDDIALYFDEIVVSVEHVDNDKYRKTIATPNTTMFNKVYDNIKGVYNSMNKLNTTLSLHAKIIDIDLSDEEKQSFIDTFTSITTSLNIDQLQGWGGQEYNDTKLGKDVTIMKDGITPVVDDPDPICYEMIAYQIIAWNGNVIPCGVDYLHANVLGNIHDETLTEIWNGDKRKKMILDFIDKKRYDYDMCRSCEWIKSIAPKNRVHMYRDKLRGIYNESISND